MSFLEINNWAIPIAHGVASRSFDEIGSGSRAHLGDWRDTRRAIKRKFNVETTWLDEADAVIVEGLILGYGHHWDFENDLYSAKKGLGPNTGYNVDLSTGQVKFGTRSLRIDGDTSPTANIIFDADLTGDYSVMYWFYDTGAPMWYHHVLTYDADTSTPLRYINGAVGATINNVVVSGGTVELEGQNNAGNAEDVYYDDLVIVPYKFNQSMIDACYDSGSGGGSGVAFSDLPNLLVDGTIFKTNSQVEMRGSLSGEDYTSGVDSSGSYVDNLRKLKFDLFEV